MKKLKGIGVSRGIAIAVAAPLGRVRHALPGHRLAPEAIAPELALLEKAFETTRRELQEISARVNEDHAAAEIINVQLLLLDDANLKQRVEKEIRKGVNASQAVHQVMAHYLDSLGRIRNADNSYLKEKKHDLEDVSRRLVRNLLGRKSVPVEAGPDSVIVARDLSPSETASFKTRKIAAIAIDAGGPTSHTAIMAKALEIPAVVGLKNITGAVSGGETLIVDGGEGVVIVNPAPAVRETYSRRQSGYREAHRALMPLRSEAARTTDGRLISIGANIELPEEIDSAEEHGADHIGLYRTEFLYLDREDLPGEEEQFEAYRHVVEKMNPRPVVIRTLDLGGDKFASGLEMHEEGNPFLGWRAVRFCLAREDIFRIQLRAVLRASVFGQVRMMYPLVTDVEEVRAANRILGSVRKELRAEKKGFDARMPVGVMIEVPSAALMAGALARETDFFSIGTNDLVQYALAVDRGNDRTAYLYNPVHPAVLRLIAEVVRAGVEAKIKVSVCGEMASDPSMSFLLLGMGVTGLSMAPAAIPEVKRMVLNVSLAEAVEFAREIARLDEAAEVKKRLVARFGEICGRRGGTVASGRCLTPEKK